MKMTAVTIHLTVRGPDIADHFGHVVDCYAKLEACHDELLDCSWELELRDGHAHVEIELTVAVADDDAAWKLAIASVRSAIHDAGGFTPDWAERPPGTGVVYRQTDAEVEPVSA
jgi:hypothetical protein